MKPLDPRLLRLAKATRWYLAIVVALGIFSTLATVSIAWNLSLFVVRLFIDGQPVTSQIQLLFMALLSALVRGAAVLLQEVMGHKAASDVKLQLRESALDVLDQGGSESVAVHGTAFLSELLGTRLDSLDVYFSKYLPQLVFTALVTPVLAAIIWVQDFPSGLVVVFTLPLIPLFMVLIGFSTRTAQSAQIDSLAALKGHFHEVLKGLLTLKSFGRDGIQSQVLFDVSENYRKRTMKVLRVSFLSGFALELAASLSVALIAVSIGLRLVDGQLDLLTGLFVLMLAPEVYLPLRNVGVQFHAASEGVEVSTRVLDLLETPHSKSNQPSEFSVEPILVITGESGVGKSTMLRSGSALGVWMPQNSTLLEGTVAENIAGPKSSNSAALARAVALAHVDVDLGSIAHSNDAFSGGQVQRIALARAFYAAFESGKRRLFLDEPLSSVDEALQIEIAKSLVLLSNEGFSFVIATHQKSLIDIATKVVTLA